MTLSENVSVFFKVFKDVFPVPTSGIVTVALTSCVLFCVETYFDLTQGVLSIGSRVFQSGHIHSLLLYPFYHHTVAQLLLNITALLVLCGSVEKSVGSVHFLFLFLLLASTTGLLYSLLDLLLDDMHTPTEGLLPVTLACVALITVHTKMTKGFLCGVSFPSFVLPWVLLMICTALIPRSVLLCNVIGVLVGWLYGKGWLSLMDMSEARAAILEKMTPFRLWKSVSGGMFIPASTEERRKTLLPQINPPPGSYPVQAYAPLSSFNSANTTGTTYEGWPHLASSFSTSETPLNLYGHSAVHNVGHSHGHGHGPSGNSFVNSCSHSHGQKQ
ncbi:rhomboid domain-containing protein 2 [Nematolebias whitei]|uniref:rhomboid domain-containing protein 2 n=1 Tax=Nematolebias whitei TaxID=451745 RepID=UPI00189707C7|nr:rhomboid domain-containing protein 2 [Nematolebias whitei]